MGQQVIPVGKKILIRPKKAETKTASGLYLPEIAQKKEWKWKLFKRFINYF